MITHIVTILNLISGAAAGVFLIFFIVLSIPVFIFRLLVIFLAKVFRPELAEIFTGYSAFLINDYFVKTPPRANIVVTAIIQGHLTCDELQSLVLKNWIRSRDKTTGQLTYAKFQQCPVRWLGFTFWKNAIHKFSVENHVIRASSKDTNINEEDLNDFVEKLVNAPFPEEQSPWEIHVIENYTGSCSPFRNFRESSPHQSVLVFKVSHGLCDGFSILTAFLEGLLQYSMEDLNLPKPRFPKRSLFDKLVHISTIPVHGLREILNILSHNFRSSPWKICDEDKLWYQVSAKSELIPIQVIKDIKNEFGVSFTSVLLSAISAGISKSLEETGDRDESMLCLSVLPEPGYSQKRNLSNHLTAAVFDIPTKLFKSPVDRLEAVDVILETAKKSVLPKTIPCFANLLGAHFYGVAKIMAKNRMIPTGLTNFPGVPMEIQLNGKPVLDIDFMTGCNDGKAGVAIMVVSYNQQIRVRVIAEKALMSRPKAKQFTNYITDEIKILNDLVKTNRLITANNNI